MAFLEHPEISRVKLKPIYFHIVFILVFAVGCGTPSDNKTIKASDKNLKLDNGILYHQETQFTGVLMEYYNFDTIKSETTHRYGKKHGTEKTWFENGNLAIERFYKNGFKVGLHKAWWENGKPKFEYHFNDNGEFHGMVKEWYSDGLLFREFNYTKGKETGKQRMWKPDGAIKANYEVIDGERYGLIGLKKCYTVTVNKDEIE